MDSTLAPTLFAIGMLSIAGFGLFGHHLWEERRRQARLHRRDDGAAHPAE